MSHLEERWEKNCLNCNAAISGRYCQVCGQENLEPQETVWHLVIHFFNDVTHFDGKFFSTLKYLVFKPGFLSLEYKLGRRVAYLNPIRMYLFTSALFFLIFFSIKELGDKMVNRSFNDKTEREIEKMDSLEFRNFTFNLDKKGKSMTREEFSKYMDTVTKGGLHFSVENYKSKEEYDSILKTGKKADSWLDRQLNYKEIEIRKKYHSDQQQVFKAFIDNFLHQFPKMLFISLPIFAFILKLLYKRRKEFYYTSHAIFSIHFYIFLFMMLLIIIGLKEAADRSCWRVFEYLTMAVAFYIFYYLYKAMRNFYQQRRAKTLIKYLLLNIGVMVVTGLLMAVFILFSLMKI
ncbi:MAG: DUF3667 domain-containing protein [Ferruginibacter sp.]